METLRRNRVGGTVKSAAKLILRGVFIVWVLAQTAVPARGDDARPGGEPPPEAGGSVKDKEGSPESQLMIEDPSKRMDVKIDKTPVMKTPSRMVDNHDGTVTDPQEGLVWAKSDSYQNLKKWLNWDMAHDYVKGLNEKRFAGYDDWRLPTRKELQTLYDEDKTVFWTYYWNVYDVHIDPVFGDTSCCFWSGESYKDEYAWGFNFIRGKTYPSFKNGPQQSLSVIRPVRALKKTGASASKP